MNLIGGTYDAGIELYPLRRLLYSRYSFAGRNQTYWSLGTVAQGYLEEHHPIRFNDLVLSGELWTYLADLNEQAKSRLELIIKQTKAAEGVTERMKLHDQMAWVRAMNSIRNRAEEIILREMIYGEDAV